MAEQELSDLMAQARRQHQRMVRAANSRPGNGATAIERRLIDPDTTRRVEQMDRIMNGAERVTGLALAKMQARNRRQLMEPERESDVYDGATPAQAARLRQLENMPDEPGDRRTTRRGNGRLPALMPSGNNFRGAGKNRRRGGMQR